MLINLFKNEQIVKNSNQLGHQIMTRGFQLDKQLTYLNEIKSDSDNFLKYREECFKTAETTRNYSNIISNNYDSHFNLELLGIAKYTRQYTVVVDLSESLDLILSILSNCELEAIRKLNNYTKVSKDILNFELEQSEKISITDIIDLDRNLSRWFNSLTYRKRGSICAVDLQDATYSILFSFYTELQNALEQTKDYIGTFLQKVGLPGSVYRSKSKAAIIVSSDVILDDDEPLLLGYNGKVSEVKCYCLKPFEYAERLGGGSIEYIR